MLIVGEVVSVLGDNKYLWTLYFLLNFAVNLQLV